jgi:hypothetical protein
MMTWGFFLWAGRGSQQSFISGYTCVLTDSEKLGQVYSRKLPRFFVIVRFSVPDPDF